MKTKRRIISFFLALCMLLTCMPNNMVYASAAEASEASSFSGGSGTENDPYILANADDFKKLAEDVDGGTSYEGTYFKVSDAVTEPIALTTDGGFVPIGTEGKSFNGIFDGNGKTVNLSVDLADTNTGYVGLFGNTGRNSVVKNVTTAGTVKACQFVGGIAGFAVGKIINCHNEADVTASETIVGGIVGYASSDVVNCSNSGSVSCSSGTKVGGIMGNMNAYVINCLNTGSVTGKDCIGGIAGYAWEYEIKNCVNNAVVTKTGDSSNAVGGIIGQFGCNTSITNCYYNQTENSGLCDAGYDGTNNEAVTTKKCAVSGEDIVSDTVLDSLNVYASKNTAANTALLYWKADGAVISLTSEKPELPYTITNNSTDYLSVDSYARKEAEVTVTVINVPDYLVVSGITVKDANGTDVATTKTAEGYTFTMPESDVTVSATMDIKLTQTDGVYQIGSADEMKILSNAVNNGYDTTDKRFKLTENVSLSTSGGFAPIGKESNKFKGTFDGGNNTVSLDLQLTSKDYVGLFSYSASGSVIKNITTTGKVSGSGSVGGIVGYPQGSITDCDNQADVTGKNGHVGGIAGYSWGKITNCSNSGSVSSLQKHVGGIAGYSNDYTINCSNSGSVSGSSEYVGGILGVSDNCTINCLNSGSVSSSSEYVGGIVGKMDSLFTRAINCLNTGSVTGKKYTGGIVGYAGTCEIKNCVNNAAVNKADGSEDAVGGMAGMLHSSNASLTNCYYNKTKNEGIYDAGYDESGNVLSTTTYAVSGSAIVSDTILDSLNVYADKNKVGNTALLYWKADGEVISLTSEKPAIPYTITNNSTDCLSVDSYARKGAEVTVTVNVPDYLVMTGITVKDANGDDVTTSKTDTGYTFTMPESDVTVSATTDIKFTQTDGVYQIGSADEMKIFSNAVNNGYDTTGKSFKLTSNVSLSSDDGFLPIGTDSKYFKGTFDGNGKTVTLNLDLADRNYVGLFGYCGSGSIIKNVTTTGTVKGKKYVGGAAGESNSSIINCYNEANVTAEDFYAGGITGGAYSTVINCSNSGSVSANSKVGGIAGIMTHANVVNCLNNGGVTGEQSTGGIAGYAWSGQIINCVTNGKVNKADGSSYAVGGIVGSKSTDNPTNLKIVKCYYNLSENPEVCDVGHSIEDTSTPLTDTTCAVSETDLVSDTVLDKLNTYADKTLWGGIALLYWKAEGNVISLTSEKQIIPYTIKNNSDYLTVAGSAKPGASVEITVGDIPSYMKLAKITVNGGEITANEEGKYVFTMPEKDVTVNAEVKFALTKLSNGRYAISTADDLLIFAAAVNSGDYCYEDATLTADITASTADGFEPIGTYDDPYGGSFYGDGHTLTLDITEGLDDDGTTVTGLFGDVEEAHIYDLILKGSVDGGDNTDSYTGALIGAANDYSTYVYNVYSEVAVSGSGYVGGIVGNGNNKKARLRNVVNNGTVTQKNTAEDKLAVGAVMGRGNTKYTNVYYNSEKNSGMYDCGYSNDGSEVTSDDSSVMAKTTTELFTDEVMDVLNFYVLDDGDLMFWDISAETQTVKFAKKCPAPLYTILAATELSFNCIDAPTYSRAGKTITVKTSLNVSNEMVKSITGIKVTDSSGTVMDVTKTGDDTYEFVMPKKDVKIQVICEYNIDTDSDGVYQIEDLNDLMIFSMIVAEGQTDADARVTADKICASDLVSGTDISDDELFNQLNGLIGKQTATAYRGTFDGNGATMEWLGALFGYTDGAVIKNLNIATNVPRSSAGGVVNSAKNTHIDHCNVKIEITNDNAGAGGVVAVAEDSKITNCSVTASGSVNYFGGIVARIQDNTVIANCTLCESNLKATECGGIVYWSYGETEIYNCVNQNLFEDVINAGMIVGLANMSGLTLANNFYYEDTDFYDVWEDMEKESVIDALTDKNSAVDEVEVGARYIPAKMNEYIEENPDLMEDTALNKWSFETNDETGKDVICFADTSHPEVYSIKKSDILVNTLVKDKNSYGALKGDEVTVAGVPSGAAVKVTDEKGKEITLTSNEGTYVFAMPEGDVNVSVTTDSGIEETTEIDGKTYVVAKTAEDFIKAVTSIAAGNNVLNVQIAGDITLTAAELEDYPEYAETTPAYNGTFDGAGHTVTINGLAKSMLATIGKEGVVKNLTVAGTNSSNTEAATVAMVNKGTIMNCINKVNISGDSAAGIALSNAGAILNCINKGNMNGSTYAAAMAIMNQGTVSFVANEGTIEGPSGSSKMIAMGNAAKYDIDLSSEADSSLWKVEAASLNGALEEEKADTSLLNDCREWSVLKTDTSTELVFADEENAPYYMCTTPDGDKPYQIGSPVEVTFDSADIPDGFIIGSVVVKSKYANDKLKATPVAGQENTFSFTMPGKTCQIVMNLEADGLQKDDNGYYLIGSLDDLMKVKKTIEYGNNEINVKLTADIDGYDGTPIGDSDGYSGTFDGNGHSITLAMSDDSGDYDYYGLFETLNSASVVKNLTIKGSIEANASSHVGAVAGRSYGTVTDCVNNAAVTNNSGYAGGIVGSSEGVEKNPAKLSNCVNNGDVIGYDAGGIVADIINYSVVTNCKNNGAVTATSDDAGGIVAQGKNVEIINCINAGAVSGDYAGGVISYPNGNSVINNCMNIGDVFGYYTAGGIVGYGCDNTTIKNCFNSGNVTGDHDVYAIAYYDLESVSADGIMNSFYLQTEDVNAGLESSNLTNEQDSSEAVTEAEVTSGYVAYQLRSGQAEDEEMLWGQTLSGDNADVCPVLGGETVYRNEVYKGCKDNPGNPTYAYSNTKEEAVYAPHDYVISEDGSYHECSVCHKREQHSYVNGVCSVCDAIWEETINGITYQAITEEVDGKPIGKLVTVSGKQLVAVRVTGTGEDFSESISDGKVTIPSEVTGSDTEQSFVVTEISKNAFSGAEVTEIVVPDTITEVGTEAFGETETITFKGTESPAGIKDALSPNAIVNIPEGAMESYRKALGENANIVEAHTTHIKDEGTRVEPTCEKKGSITYKCTKCGEVLEVVELDATGHTWDAGKVTKEATETEEGEKTYTCTVCGETKTEAIPKKQAVTPESPKKETVTPEPLKKGDVVRDDKGRAKYIVLDVVKKEVAYKEPVNKKAKNVSISATVKIKGVSYKVTGIAKNAFKGNKKVTKVTISSKVKTIGKQVFYGCKKLKTITIKSTKLTSKTVSKNAFKGLTKATTMKVPKKKVKAYKKLFKSKGLSSKVKVKGY